MWVLVGKLGSALSELSELSECPNRAECPKLEPSCPKLSDCPGLSDQFLGVCPTESRAEAFLSEPS